MDFVTSVGDILKFDIFKDIREEYKSEDVERIISLIPDTIFYIEYYIDTIINRNELGKEYSSDKKVISTLNYVLKLLKNMEKDHRQINQRLFNSLVKIIRDADKAEQKDLEETASKYVRRIKSLMKRALR